MFIIHYFGINTIMDIGIIYTRCTQKNVYYNSMVIISNPKDIRYNIGGCTRYKTMK